MPHAQTERLSTPITIVGASLAGLFAAGELARIGLPVRVFEGQISLSLAPRTLIVTPELRHVLGFSPEQAVLNQIRYFQLISRNSSTRIQLQEPDLVVERQQLLDLLIRRATAAGATVQTGHRLEDLTWDNGSPVLTLHTPRGVVEQPAPTLVGAEGLHSVVADRVGRNHHPRVAILQARTVRPADCPADTVRVWFDSGSTRFFYWLIPEGKHSAVVGLIADTPEQAASSLRSFLDAHALESLAFQGTLVPLHPHRLRLKLQRGAATVFLVGDAAGHVKATTVGGAVAGLRGANAIVHSILQGDGGGPSWRRLCSELRLHRLFRQALDHFDDADYDALLARFNQHGRAVLSVHNRDNLAAAAWKLLLAQPRWLVLAVQALGRKRCHHKEADLPGRQAAQTR